ncbi:MAG: type II toxin-antitoxin system VapC family toxin [Thermoleophilia bacterium]
MGARILVDTSVLLDILTEDPVWYPWSAATLAECAEISTLAVNPVIYAEVSMGFERIEDVEEALPAGLFARLPLPWEAAFLAGTSFLRYRRAGGVKRSPLPDFFIGAHALVERMALVTRDPARHRTYFPGLRLIAP